MDILPKVYYKKKNFLSFVIKETLIFVDLKWCFVISYFVTIE